MLRPKPSGRTTLVRAAVALALVACNAILNNSTSQILDGPGDGGASCERTACAPNVCGPVSDGCGGVLVCECQPGTQCNGNRCECLAPACDNSCGPKPTACGTFECGGCSQANYECPEDGGTCQCQARSCEGRCGAQPDGCGGRVAPECPACPADQACGTVTLDVCGPADAGPCVPRTCALPDGASRCGLIAAGCGGPELISCPDCAPPQTCGGGGVEGICGCTPKTCGQLGAACGVVSDPACGGTIDCGACPAPQTCGGGGIANRCGCTPQTCAGLGFTCGSHSDGCGGILECGACGGTDVCSNGTCGPSCIPQSPTVACRNKCGTVSDGCPGGGSFACPACGPSQTCENNLCVCHPLERSVACAGRCGQIIEPSCNSAVDCGDTCDEPNTSCSVAGTCVCSTSAATCQGVCCGPGEGCYQIGCCNAALVSCGLPVPTD